MKKKIINKIIKVIKVKSKILELIRQANKQVKRFNPKRSEIIIGLELAGRYMAGAFNFLIKGILQREYKTRKGRENAMVKLIKITNDKDISDLWSNVEYLKGFYYHDSSYLVIKRALRDSKTKLLLLIKKYKLQ